MQRKKILMGYSFIKGGFAHLEEDYDIIYPDDKNFSKEEVIELIKDVDIFVPNFSSYTGADIIDEGKNLKLICNFGVGYDNIDVVYAASKGITVTNTPQSVLEPTAELCFALILATARRIGYFNNKLHNNERVDWSLFGDLGVSVYGQTLGIYGMGRIGQAVARRAVASGMRIIYHNRHRLPVEIEDEYGAIYVDFDTLLKESDFVSLNAPATAETKHIIGKQELEKMKTSAILINTARGSLLNEQELIKALQNNIIYAAGLDVYENEPKISPDFFELDNVVLTPHIGTKTMAYRLDMQKEVAKNILNFFGGGQIDKVN